MAAGCRVDGAGGVRRPNDEWNDRIPDGIVSCVDSDKRWIERPHLLVEVLSPSTKRVDAREMLAFYGDIASVEEILLVWPDQRRVDLWQRQPDSWTVRTYIGSSALPLRATTEPLPLDELYEPMGL